MPAVKAKKLRDIPTPRQQIAYLAERRSVHEAFGWFRSHESELCQWQMEFTSIPGSPFGESARAAWLKSRFRKFGLQHVEMDEAGNVFGVCRGAAVSEPYVALSAHIDTVFPKGTPIRVRRDDGKLWGPGISDNGSGVTALLAIASALQKCGISHTAPVVFIGNVGEEGEGDLRGMRHIFFKSRWRDAIGSIVIIDGAGVDTIVNQALGSRRFEVTVRARGGHSWNDFGEPNPIAILARAIAAFYKTEVSRAPKKRSAYNVGTIQGGTSVNSIPESASMRVDLRSESAAEIERLETTLRNALGEATGQELPAGAKLSKAPPQSVTCEFQRIGDRPSAELPEDARILEIVRAVDHHLGIHSRLHRASTDANIPLSLGREAVSLGAGGTGGGAHTVNEWFDPAGRDLGLKRILLAVLALAE